MSLNAVSNILWRERQLLEMLVFKLEEEQLLLAAGRPRWLPHATREVEAVLAEIKRLELDRAVRVNGLATEFDLPEAPTLRDLVEGVPSPWDSIFDDHRVALIDAAHEVETIARGNRDLLARGQQAARATLDALTEGMGGVEVEVEAYRPARSPRPGNLSGAVTRRLVDEAI